MRVIAGNQKRRGLRAPRGADTRPILDRVKQALFDALGSWYGTPARLPPLRVLDIYCGGGTLGIEALSRGAASCTFVERGRQAMVCLRSNLATLRLSDVATICAGPAQSVPIPTPRDGPFDLIFLDPPFVLSSEFAPQSQLGRVLDRLGDDVLVAADALCIWRYDAAYHPPDPPLAGWRSVDRRVYGRSELNWLIRA
ncbi:MAG: RsmD family RNA methyltransferase [Phycisphaerae bacterium]|nr:RsmD family RNA methyltransferase [Phycisphaerae bacterium]NUQ44618.1 RsmD family RNA methyltransferase [Phycisphaerae bacterium]